MKALVLCAGFATRLYPLTRNQAKPLLDIGGRPMLSWLMDRLLRIKELDAVYIVGNERFHSQFLSWRDAYPSPVPIHVLNDGSTADENKLGAIGDMAFAMRHIPDDDLLVVAGDNLLEFDLDPFAREFLRARRPMILVREVDNLAARSRYNEVILDANGAVISFREKPPDPKSNLAAICLYFFPPGIRNRIEDYLTAQNNPDAPGYFIQWLVTQTPVQAMIFEHGWFDIGNLQTLEAARVHYAGRIGATPGPGT
jgi:glucose-1-phosphate thymidylyltransferase